jgi:hypothetical protein
MHIFCGYYKILIDVVNCYIVANLYQLTYFLKVHGLKKHQHHILYLKATIFSLLSCYGHVHSIFTVVSSLKDLKNLLT